MKEQNNSKKPFYKSMWFWIGVVILIFIIATFGGQKGKKQQEGSGNGSDTTPSQLTVGYDDYNVKSSKTYNINYTNSDWEQAVVKVKKATVYKLDKPYKVEISGDKKEQVTGFIKLDMSVKAINDITIYPTQATANYGNEQAEGMGSDTWDGDINKGAKKSGTVYFPVKDLKNPSSISSMRLKFSGNNQNHILDDHDYDITLHFK